MLKIVIPGQEMWDEGLGEFVYTQETTLSLEHSLVSISKWESKYHKPYLSKTKKDTKTQEELLYYIKCMTLTQNVDDKVYRCLTSENFRQIEEYIQDPMTATTFAKEETKTSNRQIITSELIYYWMIALNIPVEFQKWHINRLLTLIRVCNIKNNGNSGKKMSAKELAVRNTALNAARRRRLNSSG